MPEIGVAEGHTRPGWNAGAGGLDGRRRSIGGQVALMIFQGHLPPNGFAEPPTKPPYAWRGSRSRVWSGAANLWQRAAGTDRPPAGEEAVSGIKSRAPDGRKLGLGSCHWLERFGYASKRASLLKSSAEGKGEENLPLPVVAMGSIPHIYRRAAFPPPGDPRCLALNKGTHLAPMRKASLTEKGVL